MHTFARLIERKPDGTASIALVARLERIVVDVDPASFDVVGFSGDWGAAAHLVARERLATFPRSDRVAPGDARWYERRDASGTVSVLWSERVGLALAIETRRADGAASSRIAADEIAPAPAALPWRAMETFAHRNVADFGD